MAAYDEQSMDRVTRITTMASDGFGHAQSTWKAARRQPNWLLGTTVMIFLVVIALPIFLLVLLALLAATLAFLALWGINRVISAIRGLLPRDDGRRNVRVLRPGERPGLRDHSESASQE